MVCGGLSYSHTLIDDHDPIMMMCIYALKEILENHRSHNGSMFMGFLDASKAFDRLKHTTLFRKLIDRRVPNYIVRIMMYWSLLVR